MYAKGIRCRWSRGCVSSPSGHQNHERFSLNFNEIRNYDDYLQRFPNILDDIEDLPDDYGIYE